MPVGKFTPVCHRSTKRPTMCHYRRGYACLQLAGEPHRSLCPQAEGIALMDHARINSAIHEDDRSCFDFRAFQICRDAIAGRFPTALVKRTEFPPKRRYSPSAEATQ